MGENIDLRGFKVIHGEKLLNAVALVNIDFGDNIKKEDIYLKPKFIEIIAINEEGNILNIHDECCRFKFVRI